MITLMQFFSVNVCMLRVSETFVDLIYAVDCCKSILK